MRTGQKRIDIGAHAPQKIRSAAKRHRHRLPLQISNLYSKSVSGDLHHDGGLAKGRVKLNCAEPNAADSQLSDVCAATSTHHIPHDGARKRVDRAGLRRPYEFHKPAGSDTATTWVLACESGWISHEPNTYDAKPLVVVSLSHHECPILVGLMTAKFTLLLMYEYG